MPFADPDKQREASNARKRRLLHEDSAEGEKFRAAEKERIAAWRAKNPTAAAEAAKRWRERNAEEYKAKNRERSRNAYAGKKAAAETAAKRKKA